MPQAKDKILIVEDEGIVAMELEERLTHLGYDVVGVAATGRLAIESARQTLPDLVLMDINLRGGMDGVEAARFIKHEVGSAIIFLTAFAGETTLASVKPVEPMAYLLKPFDDRSLDVTVQLALHRSRAERDRDLERIERTKSEARLAAILESTHDGIVSVDDEQVIRVFNRGAERMFGYRKEEVLGKPLELLLPSENSEQHERHFHEFQQSLEPWSGRMGVREVCGVRKGGGRFPAEITLSRFQFGDERVFTACIRDVSERRRLEEQFVQAQRMQAVGRLAASVAHDFNNLLAALQANAYLLESTVTSDGRHHLLEVQSAVDRGMALTRRLLAFCRPRAEQHEVGVFDLNRVVADLQPLLTRLLRGSVSLEVRLDASPNRILADRYLVEQVLMNLVVNARDAMPDGGRVTISTFSTDLPLREAPAAVSDLAPGRYAAIRVCDTGQGIPPEVQSSVFEPFFTTKPQGEGTGLGLSTVRDIVQQAQGDVWFESTPGQGTVFSVVLPSTEGRVRKAASAAGLAEVPPARGKARQTDNVGGTVLVAEDDETLLRSICNLLQREGIVAVPASSAGEAFEALVQKEKSIDLLLSDLGLPDGNGRELAHKARQVVPGLELVFMTGFRTEPTQVTPDDLAQTPLVLKPFDPFELLDLVKHRLAAKTAAASERVVGEAP